MSKGFNNVPNQHQQKGSLNKDQELINTPYHTPFPAYVNYQVEKNPAFGEEFSNQEKALVDEINLFDDFDQSINNSLNESSLYPLNQQPANSFLEQEDINPSLNEVVNFLTKNQIEMIIANQFEQYDPRIVDLLYEKATVENWKELDLQKWLLNPANAGLISETKPEDKKEQKKEEKQEEKKEVVVQKPIPVTEKTPVQKAKQDEEYLTSKTDDELEDEFNDTFTNHKQDLIKRSKASLFPKKLPQLKKEDPIPVIIHQPSTKQNNDEYEMNYKAIQQNNEALKELINKLEKQNELISSKIDNKFGNLNSKFEDLDSKIKKQKQNFEARYDELIQSQEQQSRQIRDQANKLLDPYDRRVQELKYNQDSLQQQLNNKFERLNDSIKEIKPSIESTIFKENYNRLMIDLQTEKINHFTTEKLNTLNLMMDAYGIKPISRVIYANNHDVLSSVQPVQPVIQQPVQQLPNNTQQPVQNQTNTNNSSDYSSHKRTGNFYRKKRPRFNDCNHFEKYPSSHNKHIKHVSCCEIKHESAVKAPNDCLCKQSHTNAISHAEQIQPQTHIQPTVIQNQVANEANTKTNVVESQINNLVANSTSQIQSSAIVEQANRPVVQEPVINETANHSQPVVSSNFFNPSNGVAKNSIASNIVANKSDTIKSFEPVIYTGSINQKHDLQSIEKSLVSTKNEIDLATNSVDFDIDEIESFDERSLLSNQQSFEFEAAKKVATNLEIHQEVEEITRKVEKIEEVQITVVEQNLEKELARIEQKAIQEAIAAVDKSISLKISSMGLDEAVKPQIQKVRTISDFKTIQPQKLVELSHINKNPNLLVSSSSIDEPKKLVMSPISPLQLGNNLTETEELSSYETEVNNYLKENNLDSFDNVSVLEQIEEKNENIDHLLKFNLDDITSQQDLSVLENYEKQEESALDSLLDIKSQFDQTASIDLTSELSALETQVEKKLNQTLNLNRSSKTETQNPLDKLEEIKDVELKKSEEIKTTSGLDDVVEDVALNTLGISENIKLSDLDEISEEIKLETLNPSPIKEQEESVEKKIEEKTTEDNNQKEEVTEKQDETLQSSQVETNEEISLNKSPKLFVNSSVLYQIPGETLFDLLYPEHVRRNQEIRDLEQLEETEKVKDKVLKERNNKDKEKQVLNKKRQKQEVVEQKEDKEKEIVEDEVNVEDFSEALKSIKQKISKELEGLVDDLNDMNVSNDEVDNVIDFKKKFEAI